MASASHYVFLNGKLTGAQAARVSVFDRGFAYGDGLVETLKLKRGQPVFFQEHVERLQAGMEQAGMTPLRDGLTLRSQVNALSKANAVADGRLRIQVTRGDPGSPGPVDAQRGLLPTVLITAEPFTGYPANLYREGVACRTAPFNRAGYAGIKTTSIFSSIMARKQAQDAGAQEAIFTSPDGRMLEGGFSNLFVVTSGTIYTAPETEPILPGVVRAKLLEACHEMALPVEMKSFRIEEVDALETGAFISASIIGVCPVREIDGKQLRMNLPAVARLAEALARLEDSSI